MTAVATVPRGTWAQLRAHRPAMVGLVLLVVIAAACVIGAAFAPSPTRQNLLEPTSGPSWSHWFGTDELSRDTLSRVLHGGRISLRVGLTVAVLSTLIGTAIGAAAGLAGGVFDSIAMRGTDLWLALPGLPFLAVAAAIGEVDFGPVTIDLAGPWGISVLVALLLWGPIARVVRGATLAIREQEFVAAAAAMNASRRRIAFRHVIPNVAGTIIVAGTLVVAQAILVESTLSFLGVGIQPPTPSWGNLLSNAISNTEEHWWLTVFPGVAIFVTVLAVGLLGDGLRDVLDPRARPVR